MAAQSGTPEKHNLSSKIIDLTCHGTGFEPSVQLCRLPVFIMFFNILDTEKTLTGVDLELDYPGEESVTVW